MSITGFFAYFTLDQPLFFSSLGLLISLTSIALVAYSRFKVKAHTPIELIAGFTMGIAIVFINQWAYSLWR
jgi:membrane-associated phospholipid phosphatase